MWKKAIIIICFMLLPGCSLFADAGTKKELMDQTNKLMDHHNKNMQQQKTMIQDFDNAVQLGDIIKDAINKGDTINQNQFTQLSTSLNKVNADLNSYEEGVNKLLTEIKPAIYTANKLEDQQSKQRATKYLDDFQIATESQRNYVGNSRNLIDAYKLFFDTVSHGQIPDGTIVQQYSKKEEQLVKVFNNEIGAFNNDWKVLNEKDFNREAYSNISF